MKDTREQFCSVMVLYRRDKVNALQWLVEKGLVTKRLIFLDFEEENKLVMYFVIN